MANGTMPLMALDAVVLDTETTGLDTGVARIVQIGAVQVRGGVICDEAALDLLVDPGMPIPPASTAIHGISDDMVAGAPGFADAFDQLNGFVGDALVVGHAIGFDLAIFKRQAAEAGLDFRPWPSLDVRLLAEIAGPALPGTSLEKLAAWLGIGIAGRHTALGDARATAEILIGLVPVLRERGIRTLAEAERATRQRTETLEHQVRAGWVEPKAIADADADAGGVLGRIDSYAYRHRIAEIMSTPPKLAEETISLREAIALLTEGGISSLFLTPTGGADPKPPLDDLGIVTERDVMRAIARDGEAALDRPVAAIMTRPLASVPAEAYLYRAMGRMNRLRIRHLAVTDADNRLVGALSARDLLRLRADEAIALGDEIDAAADAATLARAWSKLADVARGLVAEGIEARAIAGVISREIGAMTRAAAVIGEARMRAAGKGGPPVAYAVLLLGSAGRGESLLAADQDNAILFESGEADGPEDRWFAELGGHMAEILDSAGIPLCKGGVMARNPEWRGSLATWLDRVGDWVRRSRPEDLLQVDIFFDLRPVHGSAALAGRLTEEAWQLGHGSKTFAMLLGEQLASYRPPLGLFGRIKTLDGRVDLKIGGLFAIVAAARALAIRHSLPRRSTHDRLAALEALDIGGDTDLERLDAAHAILVRHMLDQQLADLGDGVAIGNSVRIGRLTPPDREALQRALSDLATVPDLVRDLLFH